MEGRRRRVESLLFSVLSYCNVSSVHMQWDSALLHFLGGVIWFAKMPKITDLL